MLTQAIRHRPSGVDFDQRQGSLSWVGSDRTSAFVVGGQFRKAASSESVMSGKPGCRPQKRLADNVRCRRVEKYVQQKLDVIVQVDASTHRVHNRSKLRKDL